jgi:hypothetical protein
LRTQDLKEGRGAADSNEGIPKAALAQKGMGLIQWGLLPKSSDARKRPNHTLRDNHTGLNPSIIDLGIFG